MLASAFRYAPETPSTEGYSRLTTLSVKGANSRSLQAPLETFANIQTKLIVTKEVRYWLEQNDWKVESIPYMSRLSLIYWNYLELRTITLNHEIALAAASLRVNALVSGYYPEVNNSLRPNESAINFHRTAYDHHLSREVFNSAYLKARDNVTCSKQELRAYMLHGTSKHFKRFLVFLSRDDDAAVAYFMMKYGIQILAAIYLVFREYGNFTSPEANQKYLAILRSIVVSKPETVNSFTFLAHYVGVSIGLPVLHERFTQNLINGRLAATFEIRSQVPPLGTKAILYTAAAEHEVSQLINLQRSREVVAAQIDKLHKQAERIINIAEPMVFHETAGIYFGNVVPICYEYAITVANMLRSELGTSVSTLEHQAADPPPGYVSLTPTQTSSLKLCFKEMEPHMNSNMVMHNLPYGSVLTENQGILATRVHFSTLEADLTENGSDSPSDEDSENDTEDLQQALQRSRIES
jgi:hypothetical protein